MFFDQYPYTNMHNVNLDWVLQAVKSWGAMVEQNNQNFINLEAANQSFKEFVTHYIENLDVQEEINNKLDDMLSSGALTQYFAPYIRTDVSEWLENNLTLTTPPVDATLSIAGAAADAKATGDRIRAVTTNLDIEQPIDFSLTGYIDSSGNYVNVSNHRCTDFVAVTEAVRLRARVLIISAISSIAFYTAEKRFISKLQGENNTYFEGYVTLPENCYYVRITKWDSSTGVYASLFSNLTVVRMNELNDDIVALNNMNPIPGSVTAEYTINGYLGLNDGSLVANNNFRATDYVSVSGMESIDVRGLSAPSFSLLACYNDDKTFLYSYHSDTSNVDTTLHIAAEDLPAGTAFVRASTSILQGYQFYSLKLNLNRDVLPELSQYMYESEFWKEHGDRHGHCILKPFIFTNKKAVAFGDSITYGSYSTPTGTVTTNPTDSFIKLFCDAFNMTLDNKGSNSATLQDGIKSLILNYANYSDKDYIFIAGGTNDFNRSVPLGAFGDTTDTTFYGALDVICNHLTTISNGKDIIFISPIPCTDYYYDRVPIEYGNNDGHTLAEYRNAIFEVVTRYGFSVVNGGIIGMPEGSGEWVTIMCYDGVHPSILGYHLYCDLLRTILC